MTALIQCVTSCLICGENPAAVVSAMTASK